LKDKRWYITQEVLGVEIVKSRADYPEKKLPFIALAWDLEDGSNYGRGHVEHYLGDLITYDSLSQSLIEGAAAAAFLVFLLKPNATTNLKDLKRARNGSFINGNEDDIGVLRVDKAHDFKIAYEQSKEIEARIARAFLLMESVQRDAERVTAEEIRMMAQELDDGLGGIFSVLGVDLQRPLAELHMRNMKKRGKLPSLPKDVDLTITTGFEALGRGHDLQKLREFRDEVVALGQASGQMDIITTYIAVGNYLTRVGNAIGIDMDGMVPSEDEVRQANEQKEMMGQMMEMLKSGAGTAVAKGMVDQQPQGGPQ